MTPPPINPRKLDIARATDQGLALEGVAALADLPRLLEEAFEAPALEVRWQVHGRLEPVRGAAPKRALHLKASIAVPLQCQRCLQAVDTPLDVDRTFWFAATEAEAQRWDDETDDEVLVLSRHLDLWELIEDELLLALPIVPRHEACPQPLPMPSDTAPGGDAQSTDAGTEERPHPFAALAKLKFPL